MLLEKTSVVDKTKELCETILNQDSFKNLRAQVETFLNNDEAKLQYQSVHELGDSLNQKQRSGVELSESEISEFEQSREQLLQNTIVTDFMDAQKGLQEIQSTISKYVGMTIENGVVPTEEEIMAAGGGGCCGGGGGGGCGC